MCLAGACCRGARLARRWRVRDDCGVSRPPEDKQAIVAAFDESHEFWTRESDAARHPWSRWIARAMRRWAAGGAAYYRERVAEEAREADSSEVTPE
jgi:hypothetical protein